MRHKLLFLLILLSSVFGSHGVLAQNTLVELENTKSDQSNYSIDGNYTTFVSSNAYLPDRPEHQSGQDHIFVGRLHLPGKYLLSTALWLNQDFNNERELQARDSLLTLTKPVGRIYSGVNLIMRGAVTLPVSEASNETNGLITAFRLNPLLTYNASSILEGLTVIYRPTVIYNVHDFKTSLTGQSNHQFTTSQRVSFLYGLMENLFLSIDNSYIRSWTYDGNTNDFYSFDQSLSTMFTPRFSGFIGHSIGGNALNVNGQESDLRIFDTTRSSYYLGINYQF